MKRLFLILKKEYFDQIKEGSKRIEYRVASDFWTNRLLYKKYDTIVFQLGYSKNAKRLEFRYDGYDIINMNS